MTERGTIGVGPVDTGRIAAQVFGSRGGTLVYDRERRNEFRLVTRGGNERAQGFCTVLTGPVHEPHGRFVPAPGHWLGFHDLKAVEASEILDAVDGRPARIVDFEAGLAIEEAVHAMARSHAGRGRVEIGRTAP